MVLPRPALSLSIEPKSNADIEKISIGLHELIQEDPTLELSRHADTKEMVLRGMGQLHIDRGLEKLRRKYDVDVRLHMPKIPYRETIRTTAQAQGKHKKQTGGHGQYGDCWLAPRPRGEGFKFESKVVGGAIPPCLFKRWRKGCSKPCTTGTWPGFLSTIVSMGFKSVLETAHPVLLEPLITVEVEMPAGHIGSVIENLNARHGWILHVEAKDQAEQITALVPMAEMHTYATMLRSLTAGRGSYAMEFARYD
jgi:elongation factor G